MKKSLRTLLIIVFFTSLTKAEAQLSPLSFQQRINAAAKAIEGEVVEQSSFWNPAHTLIFTANKIAVSKQFKGSTEAEYIQVITQGGQVGTEMMEVSDLLHLEKGDKGVFLCFPLSYGVKSPYQSLEKWDVYGSAQGFFRYAGNNMAEAPFESLPIDNLYEILQQNFQQAFKIVNTQLKIGKSLSVSSSHKESATITGYSPVLVTAGTLNDPTNNVLTINGSGFGLPNSSNAVLFKDADNSTVNPTVVIASSSPYIVSWADNQIRIRVPAKAASGKFAVLISPGDTAYAPGLIDVFYSVLNAQFDIGGTQVIREPRLMNANGSGGYTVVYSTSTAGGGRDFNASAEKATFERALTTWKEGIGFNVTVGGTTTSQTVSGGDKINIIMFDNTNTGVPPLAQGVLAVTYSSFSMCNSATFQAQKVGFDIVIRNQGVSTGTTNFQIGPCFPSTSEIDLEAVVLHELGHAINLGHINDAFQSSANTFITTNPSKLMHFSVLVYTNRRSLDQSALQGGIYCVTPQSNTYGSCGLYSSEMLPLPRTVVGNDECSGSFSTTATTVGTSTIFDLAHATSNKYKDPQYTAVNCAGTGTFITNNAYQTIRTNSAGTLSVTIANYSTVPVDQINCAEEGVRLAVYQVDACPLGQQFPQPIICRTFSNNGTLADITGLNANTNYLLFFEGIRNTKAVFSATFNGSSLAAAGSPTNPTVPTNTITVEVVPNPVRGTLYARVKNLTVGNYTATIYNTFGQLITTTTQALTLLNNAVQINMRPYASGEYHLVLRGPDGTELVKSNFLKVSN